MFYNYYNIYRYKIDNSLVIQSRYQYNNQDRHAGPNSKAYANDNPSSQKL